MDSTKSEWVFSRLICIARRVIVSLFAMHVFLYIAKITIEHQKSRTDHVYIYAIAADICAFLSDTLTTITIKLFALCLPALQFLLILIALHWFIQKIGVNVVPTSVVFDVKNLFKYISNNSFIVLMFFVYIAFILADLVNGSTFKDVVLIVIGYYFAVYGSDKLRTRVESESKESNDSMTSN